MAIIVTCQCGKQLSAKDEHAGMQSTCPVCGKLIVIPGAKPAVITPPMASGSTSSLPPKMPPIPNNGPSPQRDSASGQRNTTQDIRASVTQTLERGIETVKKQPLLLIPVIGGSLLVLLLIGWLFVGGSSERSRRPEMADWQARSMEVVGTPRGSGDELAAPCAACAGCGATFSIFLVALVVLNIMLLVWVSRDAKARGMDGGVWMFVVFFTGLIGLLVYVLSRPQGSLIPCTKCANKRLQVSAVCPHCGHA